MMYPRSGSKPAILLVTEGWRNRTGVTNQSNGTGEPCGYPERPAIEAINQREILGGIRLFIDIWLMRKPAVDVPRLLHHVLRAAGNVAVKGDGGLSAADDGYPAAGYA